MQGFKEHLPLTCLLAHQIIFFDNSGKEQNGVSIIEVNFVLEKSEAV